MSPAAVSIIIFGLCVVIFIIDKLPMATTAILGCVLMVLLGVCDFSTVFGQFASSTVILTMGVMVLGAAISETGLADAIGAWITNKCKGSEILLIIGTYLASTLLSAFLTNSAVLAMFIPLVMGLSSTDPRLNPKNLVMPIVYGCVIGGTSTLVGSTQQLTAQGLLEEAGQQTFRVFDFSLVGGVLAILGLLYCIFVGRKRGEKIWGGRKCEDAEFIPPPNGGTKGGARQIIVVIVFLFTVVMYITEWIPLPVTSTLSALVCIITGCISQKRAVNAINWNVVGRLAGCLGLSKAVQVSGGTELIAQAFERVIGNGSSAFVLFCLFVFIAQLLSEFMLNSTAVVITIPIMLAIAPSLGLNTYSFALGITMATGIGLSCPLSSSTMGMSMVVGYRFSDYFKYSFYFDLIAYVTIIIMVPMLYGLSA